MLRRTQIVSIYSTTPKSHLTVSLISTISMKIPTDRSITRLATLISILLNSDQIWLCGGNTYRARPYFWCGHKAKQISFLLVRIILSHTFLAVYLIKHHTM